MQPFVGRSSSKERWAAKFLRDKFDHLPDHPVLAGLDLAGEDLLSLASPIPSDALESPWLAEVLLAQACAKGNERAWDRFLTLHREKLLRAAAAITKDEASGRELASLVLGELYGSRVDGNGHRISKLASYAGRAPLDAWLRTVLAQEHVNRCRAQKRFVSFDEATDEAAAPAFGQQTSPAEMNQIGRAVDLALSALGSEDRLLIAAYYLDERTLADVGRLLGVHESTVSRRLGKVTAALRKRVVRELRRLGFTSASAQDMLAVDVRDLLVDVRAHLTQERPL